jgi:hypothetical protein
MRPYCSGANVSTNISTTMQNNDTHTSEGAEVAHLVYYIDYGLGYSGFESQQRKVLFLELYVF